LGHPVGTSDHKGVRIFYKYQNTYFYLTKLLFETIIDILMTKQFISYHTIASSAKQNSWIIFMIAVVILISHLLNQQTMANEMSF